MSSADGYSDTGVVVIGRNEGDRLRQCLSSLPPWGLTVYVDSGSHDKSAAAAAALGAHVVELDASRPYTAARARNAGVKRLRELRPGLSYVQLIDGDCELRDGWMAAGRAFLDSRPDAAVVVGHLRERHPERSIYNLLCNMEWEGPTGEIEACGGVALMRIEAFEQAGGFREDLIAGEEPELCVRLRAAGWRVCRLNAEMAWHEAAMTRFAQWWRRTLRGGHAAAEGAFLHGRTVDRHSAMQARSALFWGLAVPAFVGAAVVAIGPMGLNLLLLYPIQIARIALRGGRSAPENWYEAVFLVLGKFPAALGNLLFQLRRVKGSAPSPIDYK